MADELDQPVDTGLGAVCAEPQTLSQTELVTVPVNRPAVALPALSPSDLARLAREVAMDIKELPKILEPFKLSEEQYRAIEQLPFFKNALTAAVIEWSSALKTPDRIKIEAAAILEDALPMLGARMTKVSENLREAVEAAKLFKDLSGLGKDANAAGGASDRVSITINLGGDTQLHYERDVTPKAPTSSSASALSDHREGQGHTETLRPIPDGP